MKRRPPRPIRSWRKKTGPREVSLDRDAPRAASSGSVSSEHDSGDRDVHRPLEEARRRRQRRRVDPEHGDPLDVVDLDRGAEHVDELRQDADADVEALDVAGSRPAISASSDRRRDDDDAVDAELAADRRAAPSGCRGSGAARRGRRSGADVDVADGLERVLGMLADLADERRGHRPAADEDDALGRDGDVRDATRDRARDEDADERDDEERDALPQDQRVGRQRRGRRPRARGCRSRARGRATGCRRRSSGSRACRRGRRARTP